MILRCIKGDVVASLAKMLHTFYSTWRKRLGLAKNVQYLFMIKECKKYM